MHAIDPDLAALDIMLVDQLARGQIAAGDSVLDIGCGGGRNLRWFARNGHICCGIDNDPQALVVAETRLSGTGCRLLRGALPDLPILTERFDVVIVNAVLHFAPDPASFYAWFAASAACMAPGGRLFVRCASRLAWPGQLPCDDTGITDGTCHFRFLPDLGQIEWAMADAGLCWAETYKTSVVGDQRCMSTLIFRHA